MAYTRAAIPNFVGCSYRSVAPEVNCEDCVNLVPEVTEVPASKAPVVLYGSPGTRLLLDLGDGGPSRGTLEIGDTTYAVSAGNVYSIDALDTVTFLGVLANDGLPVTMVANATQMLITSAGFAYVVSRAAGTVTPVAAPPWTKAADCEYSNGYFVVLDDDGLPVGGQFFLSALNDASSWDPLDFTTAPASNNKLIDIHEDHGELWVFGTLVIQVFYYNGNPDFPFVPNQTAVIQQGLLSKSTTQQLDNTLFWLGRNKDGTFQGFYADGYRAQRWTTNAVAAEWSKYPNPEDAVAWTYQINGHPTYHVSFLTAQKSWRFDRSTNLIHRVMFRNPDTNAEEAHRGINHSLHGTKHILGDRQTGELWEFTTEVDADGDHELLAYRQAPAPWFGNKIVFYQLFELITPPGIGDGSNLDPDAGTVTPEANPAWMYSWSDDNGHTFGPEYQLLAGRQGDFNKRLQKVGCGSGRNRVNKVAISANVPRCIIGAEHQFEVGTS